MKRMNGLVEGLTIAKYRLRQFTLTCKVSNDFYCVTFYNGRQTHVTYYSKDKNEMNEYIKKSIAEGYRREAI